MTTYSIDDQHGTNICGGIQIRRKALEAAQHSANMLVAEVRQADGTMRRIYAQDATHAERARMLLASGLVRGETWPDLLAQIDGVDGIRVHVEDIAE